MADYSSPQWVKDYIELLGQATKSVDAFIESQKKLGDAINKNVKIKEADVEATKKEKKANDELSKVEKQRNTVIEKLNNLHKSGEALANKRKIVLQQETAAQKKLIKSYLERKTAIKNAELALKKEVKTVRDAEKQNAALRLAVKNVDTTTAKGAATIEKYNSIINKNDELINKSSDKRKKATQNVGNYTDSIKNAISELENESQSLKKTAKFQKDLLTNTKLTKAEQDKIQKEYGETAKKLDTVNGKLSRYGKAQETANKSNIESAKSLKAIKNAFATVGVAFGVQTIIRGFKELGESVATNSQTIGDNLDIIKAKGSATFEAISRAIATADFEGLAENIRDARNAAAGYSKEQDDLSDTMRSLRVETAEVENEVYKLRGVYSVTGGDVVEKLAAVRKANELLLNLQKRRSEVTEDAINSELGLVQKTYNLTNEQRDLVASYIKDYGKASSDFKSYEEENAKSLERRIVLQKKIDEGTTVSELGIVKYSSAAKAASIELDALNENQLAGYDAIQRAIDGLSDAQRTRITEALAEQQVQEKATQRFINEATRQEAVILNQAAAAGVQTEEVIILTEAYAVLGSEISDLGDVQDTTIKDMIGNIQKYADESIAAISEITEEQKKAFKDEEERKKLLKSSYEASEEAAINTAFQTLDVFKAIGDSRIANIEQQVEAGTKTEEQGAAEIAKIQRKQAIATKAQALADIAINTAVAVSKVLGQTGIFGLAAFIPVAALGAAQAAAVLATPIPQFKDGVRGFGGGLAIVGDGGESELVRNPDGTMFMTPDTPTAINLQKGADVLNQKQINNEYGSDFSTLAKEQKITNDLLRAQGKKKSTDPMTAKQHLGNLKKLSFSDKVNAQLKGK